MPSTLGEDMANFPERYVVIFEELTKTWRIYDLRHPEMRKFQDLENDDVPDDNPGVKVINELEFAKLVAEAIDKGVLLPSVVGIGTNVEEITQLKKEKKTLEDELATARSMANASKQERKVPQGSEKFELKRHAIDTIYKMTVAEDVSEIIENT